MRVGNFVTVRNSNERPDIAWHYTSVEALVSIVTGREIWASLRASMNDLSELTYDKELLERVLQSLDDEEWPEREGSGAPNVREREFLDSVVEHVKKGTSGLGSTALSASTDPDKLSQWVHYAGPGGVAIGLDTNAVLVPPGHFDGQSLGAWPVHGFGWMRLRYDLKEQEQGLREALLKVVSAAGDESAGPRDDRIDVQVWSVLNSLQHMKHPAYREESEIRHFAPAMGGEVMRYRARNNEVVAYSTLISQGSAGPSLAERQPLAIRGVVCGPAVPVRGIASIEALLAANGLAGVEVRSSSIPYVPSGANR